MDINSQILFISLAGGVLPALVWLWFWLKEDSVNPEPRSLLLFTFLGGMLCVLLVLPIEQYILARLKDGIPLVIILAIIEELFKYVFAYFIALRTKFLNEPIDCVIYMIVVALGFAALENTLFIVGALKNGSLVEGLATENLRFIGASLLHIISSASIGIAMAFSYYKSGGIKTISVILGIIASIILHSLFNFFIIKGDGNNVFTVFGSVWIVAIIFILILEKIKRMNIAQ